MGFTGQQEPQHATRAAYRKGCRCSPCRQANADYERGRVERGTDLVDAQEVREHLVRLRDVGLGTTAIARASGVSLSLVNRLAGNRDSRPAVRLRPRTAEALLAVSPQDARDSDLISAAAARRRLQGLERAGWSRKDLALSLGWSPRRVAQVMLGNSARVSVRAAQQVRTLYRDVTAASSGRSRDRAGPAHDPRACQRASIEGDAPSPGYFPAPRSATQGRP